MRVILARPASTPAERRAAEAAVLVVMVLWAANFIVVKTATEAMPPAAFTMVRYLVAAATLLLLLRWREGSLALPRREILPIATIGIIGFGVYQVLWTAGLQTVTAGDSALLIATTPVITALLAGAAGFDTLSRAKLVGAATSFAGVAIVVGAGAGLSLGSSLTGELLTLVAAACWAVYTSFGAPIVRRFTPLRMTAWAVTFGALSLVPLGAFQFTQMRPGAMTPEVLLAVLYSATLAAGIANVVVFHGVKLLGPTRITAFQFLVPAIAVALAAIFLGEAVRPGQVAGGVVIIAGVAIARGTALPRRPRRLGRAGRA